MISYSNSTTRRLEAFARHHLGEDLHIVISPYNSKGRYFVTGSEGKPWYRWYSLGWTVAEAKSALLARTEEARQAAIEDALFEREMAGL